MRLPSATSSSIPHRWRNCACDANVVRLGQLVDRHLDRDVLAAGRDEVVVAALVAPIRAQPVAVGTTGEHRRDRRAVVDRHDRTRANEPARRLDEGRRTVDQRSPRTERAGRRETGWSTDRTAPTAARRTVRRSRRRRTPRANRRRTRRAGTAGCRAVRSRSRRRRTRRSGIAATDSMPSGCRARWPADTSTATYRSASTHAGRAASTDRASVPGPAPASTTVNTSGRPMRSHSASRYRATTAPNNGPTSGDVMKSPRRPADPPSARV